MRTLRPVLLLVLSAVLGACAGSALDGSTVGREQSDLITVEDVADLPPCGLLPQQTGTITVEEVADSGGLLVVSVDGHLLCVDDAEGLHSWGVDVGAYAAAAATDGHVTEDGTPLPALVRQDGTPLPAHGGLIREDGTPLPALQ